MFKKGIFHHSSMDIKPFNEIIKDLEGGRTTNKCDDVEALAQKLHEQGITTTLLEAREKAKSMITINENSAKDHEEKKEKSTTYNDPRNNPSYNPYRASMVQEMRKRAIEGGKAIKVQDEFQTPEYEERNPQENHSRTVGGAQQMRPAPKVSAIAAQCDIAPKAAPSVQDTTESMTQAPTPHIEVELEAYTVAKEPQVTPEPEPEPLDPEPILENKPERKKNPEVDLQAVFNFGKK